MGSAEIVASTALRGDPWLPFDFAVAIVGRAGPDFSAQCPFVADRRLRRGLRSDGVEVNFLAVLPLIAPG